MESDIVVLDDLSADMLKPLLDESLSEGYTFVQRLLDEYLSGVNRFDTPGAVLLGIYANGTLLGIGGVHQDPYLNRPDVGRVRHVYVLNAHRRHGVGKRLLNALIDQAGSHFSLLTLRTNTSAAAAFYEAIGFSGEPVVPEATHWLRLESARE